MSVAPSTVAEVQEIVRAAIRARRPIEPIGGGTQVHVGYEPIQPLERVETTALERVIEYAPADLVIVAQAGMTVAALQAVLAEHGQTLPLEVPFPERQTLGGTVATRAASLIRPGSGPVRDWLIGCTVVVGEGQVIAGGGKVVKNVAGYDLPKLFCGSWGTLGIITQVAFKVAPLTPATRMLLVTLNAERNTEEALDSLSAAMTPTFCALLNTDAARALLGSDVPSAQFFALGFDGQPEAVESLAARATVCLAPHAFQTLALPSEVAAKLRQGLRDLPLRDAPLACRFHILPSQVGAFARMLEWTARRAGFSALVMADAFSGIVWAQIAPRDLEEGEDSESSLRWAKLSPDLRDKAERVGGSCVVERMPKPWRREGCPVWSPILPEIEWTRRLKAALDPHGLFRPGRFIDRI